MTTRRRSRRTGALACLALLTIACGVQRPVQEEITIEFGEDDVVLFSVDTRYETAGVPPPISRRVEAARAAALSERDEWSLRLARVAPEEEQTVFERRRGTLERSQRQARLTTDDLPRVFADLPLTLRVTSWDRGREILIYPGSSSRATREQRENFARTMDTWTRASARYFSSIHPLYVYLDEHPGRARYVFAALFGEKGVDGAPVGVTEEEQALLNAVTEAMSAILDLMDAAQPQQFTLAEEADLIFNPFPGRLRIRVPGEIVAVESFERQTEREASIEPVDLWRVVTALRDRWISPDPLAELLESEGTGTQLPTAETLAALPRRSSALVTAGEIERALQEQLRRPATYRLRWVD